MLIDDVVVLLQGGYVDLKRRFAAALEFCNHRRRMLIVGWGDDNSVRYYSV